MSGTLPTVLNASGLQPQQPTALLTQLIAAATAISPGLTANLPGSLIEDMASTATGACVVIDQARVDLVNSLTPFGANAFVLTALGAIYGVSQGTDTNTSVFVVFSGPAGYVIPPGFIVSDGTYQYATQDGTIIPTSLSTQPVSAVATQAGSWAVPANTVVQLITSVPSTIALAVTNPLAGTPSAGPQTEEDYRAQVLQAGLVNSQGTPAYLKTLLTNITGVQARLVSVRQQSNGWEVIVGGSGDPYQIGYAISEALDISTLVGSTINVTGITNGNPAVVTTDLVTGFATGQVITITGATGMTGVNNTPVAITALTPTTFSIPLNTTNSGVYTGNGTITPNFRNVSANIYDYPDTYTIPFVIPPVQNVTMSVTWNTSATGFVSPASVAAAAQPALATYINSIPVGQPINTFELTAAFQAATASIVPTALLTRLVFSVSINGVGVSPQTGTGIIAGDPESFFQTTTAGIVVTQG